MHYEFFMARETTEYHEMLETMRVRRPVAWRSCITRAYRSCGARMGEAARLLDVPRHYLVNWRARDPELREKLDAVKAQFLGGSERERQ